MHWKKVSLFVKKLIGKCSIMKYRLRLGEIEAICWDSEENAEKIKKMLGDNLIVKTSDNFDVNFY